MRDAAFQSLAVGFFDGVHLGHQAILGGADAALTFRNHPLSVLAPEKAPRLIMTCEDRVAAIRACGVGVVLALDFTRELADLSPEAFAARYLTSSDSRLPPSIRCGGNWRFGKGGAGDAAFLRSRGIDVTVAPYVEYKGERISSSRIRRCLENGEVEDANEMLGRRFRISGSRFQGKGLGGKLGYPTVNVEILERGFDGFGGYSRILLRHGVYEVEVDGLRGVANYGLAPTMGEKAWTRPTLEIHFLGDSSGSLDSRSRLSVSILRFIRPERKFDSLDDLQRQIAADCASCLARP